MVRPVQPQTVLWEELVMYSLQNRSLIVEGADVEYLHAFALCERPESDVPQPRR